MDNLINLRQSSVMRNFLFLAFITLYSSSSIAVEKELNLKKYFESYDAAFAILDLNTGDISRYNPTNCATQFSPCSTFKIANTIIALDTEVISGPDFQIPWDEKKYWVADWNKDQTLRSAFQVSCVWYYQEVARRIGVDQMKSYLSKFQYGNENISGGIDNFWLSSSLNISPNEQVSFLKRVYSKELPVKQKSIDILLDMMTYKNEPHFILRGKTGTAGTETKTLEGWYVGILESDSKRYIFATHLKGGENPSGKTARNISERILRDLINHNLDEPK
jgi:beta-lactamase class D